MVSDNPKSLYLFLLFFGGGIHSVFCFPRYVGGGAAFVGEDLTRAQSWSVSGCRRYRSTRGGAKGLSFEQAVFEGRGWEMRR